MCSSSSSLTLLLLPLSPSSLSRRQAHADAFVRAFSTKKYPRQIIVKGEYIVSVKVDDRGFIVHKWTKKIVDLKQVYLVVKDNRRIYQLALEFVQRPGEKKPFTDVLQFDPATSRNFTQLISTMRKELLGNARGSSGAGSVGRSGAAEPQRFSDKYGEEVRRTEEPYRPAVAPEPPRPSGMNSFASAIANANANRGASAAAASAGFQPAPAQTTFTPATAAVSDPFADPGVFVPAPTAPQSPSPPSSVSDPFNAMMQSVNANGHQMETLFTPPPSVGYGGGAVASQGAVSDPFAAMAAPAPAPAAMPVSDPFAAMAAPAPAAPANNPFAAAPGPAASMDPFAMPPQQQAPNPFAAPPPQQHNPFA
jgi:hypothetical protein